MLTFYILRHGTTEHNANGRIMGQIDSPLTPGGIKEAKWLGKKLATTNIDAIYSSDLGRAFISAYIINKARANQINITTSKELRETNYGIYQNMLKVDADKKCKQYKKDPAYVYPEGESANISQKRAIDFIQKLEKKHKEQSILLVTHSGLIRTIISHFNNLPLIDNLKLEISHHYIGRFIVEKGNLKEYKVISA